MIKKIRDTEELPLDLSSGSRTPKMPYGHPDLLLGRAAAAGLITSEAAQLISATRFGDALIEQLAAEKGVTAPVLRMRRRRAERIVAAAVTRGDLSGPALTMGTGQGPRAEGNWTASPVSAALTR